MRKLLISMLLAGAAASPAWAAPEDYSDRRAERQSARENRQSTREDRQSAREERSSTREESKATREERQTAREQIRVPRGTDAPRAQLQQSSPRTRAAQDVRIEQRTARERSIERPARATQQVNEVQAIRDARVSQRQQRMEQSAERLQQIREARRNAPPPVVSNTPAPNTQPPPPTSTRSSSAPQWNTSWRNNSRYNWNKHRRRHRSLFHLGFYFDPFGWGYQPYRLGWRMWPSYYGSSFWLNDPWQYRLPYAPPGTRWIRYYNDAILVDMWSGQVIDVIYSFFW